MAEEIAGSPLEVKAIATRALVLQRYLLRRAWGALYATWSVAIFQTIFGAAVEAALGFSLDQRVSLSVLASGAALAITLREFRRVRDTAEIRRLAVEGKWTRVLGYHVAVPAWVAAYVIVVSSFFLFGAHESSFIFVLLAAYAAFWAFLWYALRLSFQEKMPAEGVATLASFGAALAGTVLNELSLGIYGVYVLLWGATVVVWVVSAVYARRLAVPGSEVNPAV